MKNKESENIFTNQKYLEINLKIVLDEINQTGVECFLKETF
ncbi:MAG: hypothetical protein ACLRQZ_07360 [Clostridia bacterium]